jgi:hypothetical protein
MAKTRNTFNKRRREQEKKQQAEDKRARKRQRNEGRPAVTEPVIIRAPREDVT